MTEHRTLDWIPRFDEKSRAYPIRATIGTVIDQPRVWSPPPFVLDQGREGACVGFGWTGELIGSPYPDPYATVEVGERYARSLYRAAQVIDEWEGEDYEGTSVLAGAKALKARGLINEYRWAFSIGEVRDALITTGPVVVGVPWFDGMYETDANGIVSIGGDLVGGHCLFVYEYHPAKRLPGDWYGRHRVFRWRNSWGPEYGLKGSGYVHYDDLAKLLEWGGEACVPVTRSRVRLTA